MIALSLGFAPRTHAPPELNYNFAASVQTGLNPAVAYAQIATTGRVQGDGHREVGECRPR